MHLITLCFDDGFKKSTIRTAEIFEKFNLRASFFVLSSGSFEGPTDPTPPPPMGDFGLWNDLVARGHDVLPHGFNHTNKKQVPFEQGRTLIEKCFDGFERNLRGFERSKTIFGYPYGASTPQLNDWLKTQVRAVRVGDVVPQSKGMNPLPSRESYLLSTVSAGPGTIDATLEKAIDEFLANPAGGWLIYSPHGLDGEGWGPMTSAALERLLEKLTQKKIPVRSLHQVFSTIS